MTCRSGGILSTALHLFLQGELYDRRPEVSQLIVRRYIGFLARVLLQIYLFIKHH
jgi:hypothetical protein